ncbi:hypothetical protein BH695_0577 [Microcystis aeruginosa PCC 7806SL]|uniref:Uncharacterized protein n=1 Tax=Microcystis aeruginosa PCC 7806SL TaxID=1903187 RepID=A0AB33BKA2_MICA7|nr:hypothetical protein BH695_0577 [Microcystis aeruginosa PCC 7806SL]
MSLANDKSDRRLEYFFDDTITPRTPEKRTTSRISGRSPSIPNRVINS